MILKFKFLALNKINKARILYSVWVLLLTSLGTEIKGQQNKYSFSDMNEFSEFIDIIKTKKEIPDKCKAKINASGLRLYRKRILESVSASAIGQIIPL